MTSLLQLLLSPLSMTITDNYYLTENMGALRNNKRFKEFYLGQCEAGFWKGHNCSTVVSQVIAWTE